MYLKYFVLLYRINILFMMNNLKKKIATKITNDERSILFNLIEDFKHIIEYEFEDKFEHLLRKIIKQIR